MAGLILPSRLNQQPQQTLQVDWSNPLTRGLVLAVYPIGTQYYDAISKQYAKNTGSSRYRNTINGNQSLDLSLIGTGSGAAPKFANPTGLDAIAGPFSIFCEGSLEVNNSTQDIVKSWEGGSGFGVGLVFDDTAVITNGFLGRVDNSTNNFASLTNAIGANSEQFTHRIAITSDGATRSMYGAGVLNTTIANSSLPTANANRRTYLHSSFDPTSSQSSGSMAYLFAWSRAFSLYEYQELFRNPAQLLKQTSRKLFFGAAGGGGGGSTGTLATTNANDTSSASGTTTVLGTLARTNANDTSAASGSTTVVGSLAKTSADDTLAASGSVGGGASGTLATTNANDTLSASGTTTVVGTLAKMNANDAVSAAGFAGLVSGTVSYTNANDSISASGTSGSGTFGRAGAGGDDAPRLEVYEKRKVKRTAQDEENERKEILRATLNKMRGIEPEAKEVEIVVQPTKPIAVKSKTVIATPEMVDAILGRRKASIVKAVLIDESEEDDEETLLMLL